MGGIKKTPVFKLSAKQKIAYDLLQSTDTVTRQVLYGGSGGGGKSILGCYWIIENCFRYPGTRYLIGRKQLTDLKKTVYNSFKKVIRLIGLTDADYNYNKNENTITFPNGSEIYLYELSYDPSDQDLDRFGGLEITAAFIDEAGQIAKEVFDVVNERIRERLTDFCGFCDHNLEGARVITYSIETKQPDSWLCPQCKKRTIGLTPKCLATCNPTKNFIYSEFYIPFMENRLQNERKFIRALIQDNPFRPPSYFKQLMLSGDKARIARMVYGDWTQADDPTALCSIEDINKVFTNVEIQPDEMRRRLSADIALEGADRCVILYAQGNYVEIVLDQLKSAADKIEEKLRSLSEEHGIPEHQIVVDSQGIGNYLRHYMKSIKPFRSQHSARHKDYKDMRSQCGFKLADKIKNGQLKISCTPQQRQRITKELEQLKQVSVDDDQGKRTVIKKADMRIILKHSPDYVDALIMLQAFDLTRQLPCVSIPA